MFDPYVFRLAELQSEAGDLVVGVPIDEYIKEIERCKTYSIEHSGMCVGGAIMKDERFHIAVLKDFQGLVGFQIIRAMMWGFSISTPFVAIVHKENKPVMRLVKFFNHQLIGQDAQTLTFALEPRGGI